LVKKKYPNISECLTVKESTGCYNVAVAASVTVVVSPVVVRTAQTCVSLVGKFRVSLKHLFQTEIASKLNIKRHTFSQRFTTTTTRNLRYFSSAIGLNALSHLFSSASGHLEDGG
jgi:hypothetical protein